VRDWPAQHRRDRLFLILLFVAAASPGRATVVATNLGSGGAYGSGQYILQGNPIPGENVAQSFAVSFTPTVSATLREIVLPLEDPFGSAFSIDVGVATDNSGAPGSIITTLTVNGTIPSATSALVSFTCSSCPTLTAGQRYWIVTGASGSTFLFWYWASSDTGGYDSNSNGSVNGPWFPSPYNTPAFQVDGDVTPAPTPAPGSLLLALAGSGSVGLYTAMKSLLKRNYRT